MQGMLFKVSLVIKDIKYSVTVKCAMQVVHCTYHSCLPAPLWKRCRNTEHVNIYNFLITVYNRCYVAQLVSFGYG